MKKEYLAVGIIALFLLGHALDYVAGPVNIVLRSPFEFTQGDLLSRYPFTTVSIIIKTIALFSTFLLVFSLIEKKLLAKGLILLFIAALFELYAIQQLATGVMMIPIQWILTLSLTGIILLLPAVLFIVFGVIALLLEKTIKNDSETDET
jgi:hypothetical protein